MITCIFIALSMPGGSISDHAAAVDLLNNAGCQVRIEGQCASSCTMFLGASNVCVTRDAVLVFHGPSGRGMSAGGEHHWAEVMASHYPGQLYDWFMDEARFGEYAISGEWLIANGITGECQL